MQQVRIIRGTFKGETVTNEIFKLSQPLQVNRKGAYLVVENDGRLGDGKKVRVNVSTHSDFEYLNFNDKRDSEFRTMVSFSSADSSSEPEITETDDEAMDRIATRFSILDQMSASAINGDIRALIVSGPPGIGKSFGVEQQMEQASIVDRLADRKIRYEVVKGATTALGLYAMLYKFSDHKNILIFDDCDSVLSDDLSLNILKAALDSGKRRKIFWNSDSALLRREGIPDSFNFNGSVIFITNLKFDKSKSKKLQDHLDALQSRCHYLDLTVDSQRDLILRIKQVHRDAEGGLFADYYFDGDEADQVFEFMWENKDKLRELSLRMCLKIADLVKISPDNWKTLAKATVCRD